MKKIVVVLVVLLMVAGIGAGVYLVQQSAEYRGKAAPASTLSFDTTATTRQVGQEFIVNSVISTAENQVIAVELFVSYDSDKLELLDVSPGNFFANPSIIGPIIDNNIGKLSYAIQHPLSESPVQGTGAVASLSFKAIQEGTVTISYAQESIVAPVGETVDERYAPNALIGSTPITLNIESVSAASPSPTQEPEVTETPTPSPTVTAGDGIGGNGDTPTSTITSTPSPTDGDSSSTTTSTNTPTAADAISADQLPDSGVPGATLIGIGTGIFVLFIGIILAL